MKKTEINKYKYFKTLGDSIRTVVKNPRLLAPYLLLFVVVLVYSFVINGVEAGRYTLSLTAVILMTVLVILLSLFIGGWVFSMVNQLMTKNKFSLASSTKRAPSFAIRGLAISVIAILFLAAVYFIISLLILACSKLGISIIGLIIGLLFVVFVLLFLTALAQATPVLIIQDRGVIETIQQTLFFYFRKKLYSLNIFLVSILFTVLLLIPSIAYSFSVAMGQMQQLMATQQIYHTITQRTVINLLQLPSYLGTIVVIIYYCISYKIKKATIK